MKSIVRKRIIVGVWAFLMGIITLISAETVKAEDSNLPAAKNISFSTANNLQFNTSIAEEATKDDAKRYYKFTIKEACELNINVTTSNRNAGMDITIYDALKTATFSIRKGGYKFNTDSIYLTGGEYYLEMYAYRNEYTYSFLATIDSVGESFVETQDVNNDMVSSASSIALKKKYKGVLAANDEVDYYKFKVPSAGRINFNMVNATNGTLKYVIYDSSLHSCHINTISNGKKAAEYISLAKGNYYLAITKNDSRYGVGSYNFSIDYVADKVTSPKIKTVRNTGKKEMKVTWKKVSGISGYEIQYSTSKTFKKDVKKKKVSASKTSVTFTKLKKGKKYYVRMRSYKVEDGVKKYSKWCSKKSVKIKK